MIYVLLCAVGFMCLAFHKQNVGPMYLYCIEYSAPLLKVRDYSGSRKSALYSLYSVDIVVYCSPFVPVLQEHEAVATCSQNVHQRVVI